MPRTRKRQASLDRDRDSSPPAPSSPTKKRRLSSSSFSFSLPTTPFDEPESNPFYDWEAPGPSHAYLYPPEPTDSPTNPFGRRRSLAPRLPPPTKFRRHVVLRFQFIRSGTGRGRGDGVYRVVQVPLSYTLLHVRVLIAWLFGGQCGMPAEEEQGEEEGGKKRSHLFEIRKNVVMWAKSYRPGTIKRSTVKIRLSSVGDPYRGRREGRAGQHGDGEEEEEPRWEAEEDFTLEHVFNSPDDDEDDEDDVTPRMKPVGIVYVRIVYLNFYLASSYLYHTQYHTNSTQIHITLNTAPVQSRKGKGNTPTVFKARGHVYLNPVNIIANTPLASDDGSLAEDEYEEEDLTAGLVGSNWDGDAFEDYLSRVGVGVGVENPMYALRDVGEASSTTSLLSTPSLDLDISSSSPMGFRASSPPAPPPSSIPFPPSSSPPVMARSLSLHSFLASSSPASSSSPFRSPTRDRKRTLSSLSASYSMPHLSAKTPALPAAQRKRNAYLAKRIERSRQRTKSRPKRREEREDVGERVRLNDNDEGGKDSESGSDQEPEPDEEAPVQEEVVVEGEELGMVLERELEKAGRGRRRRRISKPRAPHVLEPLRVRSADGRWMTVEEALRAHVDEDEV
ncbi:hypothetical protein PQX77_015579 [Marasmius sp. AFHP31]|nr:hypothetical protein PQX77_015579 [Marasmius sp. AFHP31]